MALTFALAVISDIIFKRYCLSLYSYHLQIPISVHSFLKVKSSNFSRSMDLNEIHSIRSFVQFHHLYTIAGMRDVQIKYKLIFTD